MSRWASVAILDVASRITSGGTPSTKVPSYYGGDIPWLNTKEINFNRITKTETCISEAGLNNSSAKWIDPDSVIIAMYGATAGKVAVNKIALTTNQACCNVTIDSTKADYRFVYYSLVNSYDELLNLACGAAQQNLNAGLISSFLINLPQIPEQKAIAAVLSSLDDKIDLLYHQNKTIKAMAETLFRQWFVEEVQEDWEEVSVGDFVEVNRASIDKKYPHSTIQYLDTGSLTEGKAESFQKISLGEAPSRAKRLVQHNDVLISTVRPDQRHYGIIKNPPENLVVSTGFCVLSCTEIDPHFIYLLLTDREMTSFLHSIAEGSTSTYPSLKPSDIASIKFQLPPHDKIDKFAKFAQSSWDKIEKNHIQIRTLVKLRDTILPKLVSGEVRVAY